MATVSQDLGTVGAALQLPLMAAILKLLPEADRQRELQLIDEADEARWVQDALLELDAEAGPPPF
jgi:hypothetical protein